GFALAKVQRFPGQLDTCCTAPDTVIRTRPEYWARNRRHDRLCQQQTEDVVGRRTILLPEHVEARQVGRPRHADPSVGGLRAGSTLFDRRIVPERELDDVIDRDWA